MTDRILINRSVVEQALKALKYERDANNPLDWHHDKTMTALCAALEQPQSVTDCHQSHPQVEQEPVAWQYRARPDWGIKKDCWGPWMDCTRELAALYQRVPSHNDWVYESRPLYTHPQQLRQPLTDEQIFDVIRPLCEKDDTCRAIISVAIDEYRAIERAHGIGVQE